MNQGLIGYRPTHPNITAMAVSNLSTSTPQRWARYKDLSQS
jgi:hypothetical protein